MEERDQNQQFPPETTPAPVAQPAPADQEPAAGGQTPDEGARMWGMFCHLAALSGYVTGIGFIVGPLIVWLIKRDEYAFANDQGKEALNFQISVLMYAIVAGLLIFACIGIVLLPAVGLFQLIFTIVAGVKANNGVRYRYPMTIRFIK